MHSTSTIVLLLTFWLLWCPLEL
uniref:Uncharacterized protein n=1 Tax=Arundo donax TaxID=35708 RepID=A0A0A8XWA8_ARUDO